MNSSTITTVLVLAGVAIGGYFLYSDWDTLFPPSTSTPTIPPSTPASTQTTPPPAAKSGPCSSADALLASCGPGYTCIYGPNAAIVNGVPTPNPPVCVPGGTPSGAPILPPGVGAINRIPAYLINNG